MGTGNDDGPDRDGRADGDRRGNERRGHDRQPGRGSDQHRGGRGRDQQGGRNQQPRDGRQPRGGQQPQGGQQPRGGRRPQGNNQPRQGQQPQQGRQPRQGQQPQQGRQPRQGQGPAGGGQGPPGGPNRGPGGSGGGGSGGGGLGSRLSGVPVKAVVAIALVALVGAGAAQVLVLGGGGDSAAPSGADASDAVMQVPSGADSVVRMDPGVLEDETMADLYAEVYDATVGNVTGGADGGQTGPGSGMPAGGMGMVPETLAELRQRIERQAGVDPTAVEEVVVFQKQRGVQSISQGQMPAEPYTGAVVHAEWSEGKLVGMIEENAMQDLEKTTVSGTTVYRPAGGGGGMGAGTTTSGWLAVLADGEYAVGTPEVVRDVIAVENGDADAVGGDLLDAYERTPEGFVRMAQRSPSIDPAVVDRIGAETGVDLSEYVEAYNDLHVTATSTYTTGSGVGSKTVVLTNSTETAKDVASMADGLRSIQAGAVQNPALESELRAISIERDGTTVTVSRETSVDDMVAILEWYMGLFEGGAMSMPTGNPVA